MSEPLSIVLGQHGQVRALRDGSVRVDGYALDFVDVKRMPDAYRAMARQQPYDICEMAPTSYLMAVAAGAPITALPLPMTRRFRHAGLQRRRDSDIRQPTDLEGRTVGSRTYAVSAAVWTRGILADDYGVDLKRIEWLTEEDENVETFVLPRNARRIPDGETLADLMRRGQLDAAFGGLAGLGADPGDALVELVEDAAARESRWFERTGIYPLHGVIVARNDVLARHPTLATRLFDAFVAAKERYLDAVRAGRADTPEDRRYRQLAKLVGDPLPYGLQENKASLEALIRYAHEQGLIETRPSLDSVFLDPRGIASPLTV
ncbi:ABC transporter substrate-binding protein [Chitinasiproducens palmae]|uniref:4,5-dihydroxyphthalate decarboxylase n=1 Tax=Chitinasiproducens palmae TaxID=1770053 RepID=A0A1H2PUX2_9BURK|nr:hypothetical protein [Chitinasiproducens palmae]SDV50600.1 4,5-dihydroxyphthalate decarboxylase [Chitinasiproducens palmae]